MGRTLVFERVCSSAWCSSAKRETFNCISHFSTHFVVSSWDFRKTLEHTLEHRHAELDLSQSFDDNAKAATGRGGNGWRFASSNRHSVGSFFSAMTLMFLLRMSKFSSSLREILLMARIPNKAYDTTMYGDRFVIDSTQWRRTFWNRWRRSGITCCVWSSVPSIRGVCDKINMSALRTAATLSFEPLRLKIFQLHFQTHDREVKVCRLWQRFMSSQHFFIFNLHRHGEPLLILLRLIHWKCGKVIPVCL